MADNDILRIGNHLINQLTYINDSLSDISHTIRNQSRSTDICHNIEDPYEDREDEWTFNCSNCGTDMKIRFETLTMYGSGELPNYCPYCGYKVE